MSDISTYPLEDNYSTTLTQALSTSWVTMFVATAPSFTFPSSTTSYCVINPWKTTMEIVKISALDTSAKSITISSRNQSQWASVTTTAQTHPVWSKVIISDNYAFWSDIVTAVNSKVDESTWWVTAYADTTARDAAITTAANWMQVYLTDTGKFTDYTWWSWVDRESGWTFPNASATVAWKVELATDAEVDAWTWWAWWSWATIVPDPSQVAETVQEWKWVFAADAEASDTYVISLTPNLWAYVTWQTITFTANTANTWACTLNVDSLWAKTIKWSNWEDLANNEIEASDIVVVVYDGTNFIKTSSIKMATDAEATTWTLTQAVITAKQGKDNYENLQHEAWYFAVASTLSATWNLDTTTSSLNGTPKLIEVTIRASWVQWDNSWRYCKTLTFEWTTLRHGWGWGFVWADAAPTSAQYSVSATNNDFGSTGANSWAVVATVTDASSWQFILRLAWTKTWTPSNLTWSGFTVAWKVFY